MKRVAIVQSNYIPWKGYFDLIAAVDEFILYDDVQYTRRDWRNRNLIKTPDGLKWLTIPVEVKGKYEQTIRQTRVADHWQRSHWAALEQNYRKATHFAEVADVLRPLYFGDSPAFLSEINALSTRIVCDYLGIGTTLGQSNAYSLADGPTERLASLCRQAGAATYVSGPAARDYLDEAIFEQYGIAVEWFDYSGYPEYPQLYGPFEHGVSVVDLLFNCGRDAPRFMKHVQPAGA